MRIVVVNHLHPDAPTIGGVRLARFAEALAERGHRVVLLTGSLGPDDPVPDPAAVEAALARHDGGRPFHLVCPPMPMRRLAAAREGRIATPLRQGILAWHYLRHGGVFSDWQHASRAYWPALADRFKPDVVWATFGNTDAWSIARGLARRAGCPWGMDIKDIWSSVPAAVAGLLARRFDDAAACTGLSQGHIDRSGNRFPGEKTVIYSGIPASLLAERPSVLPFRITITGSTYGWLTDMVRGIGLFLGERTPAERAGIVLTYAGSEAEAVGRAVQPLSGQCGLDIRPYVPLTDLAILQHEAFLNLYGRFTADPSRFHHKVFELLCAGRPIACYPTEYAEALSIAAEAGLDIAACGEPADLARTLTAAWQVRRPQGERVKRDVLARYTWQAQAARLEAVLQAAVLRAAAGRGR